VCTKLLIWQQDLRLESEELCMQNSGIVCMLHFPEKASNCFSFFVKHIYSMNGVIGLAFVLSCDFSEVSSLFILQGCNV
jgi:hypothetical protein